MQMLQMQSQLQYLNAQAIQQGMKPGDLQAGMSNRQQLLTPLQMQAQHGQQQLPLALLQQSMAMAQQQQQLGFSQLLAAQRAQRDPASPYYGMYYGT